MIRIFRGRYWLLKNGKYHKTLDFELGIIQIKEYLHRRTGEIYYLWKFVLRRKEVK